MKMVPSSELKMEMGASASLEELWIQLRKISVGRTKSNEDAITCGHNYPLELREIQVESAQVLLDGIKAQHARLRKDYADK